MATGFLGYYDSPKWFNIKIFNLLVKFIYYIITYYTLNIINYINNIPVVGALLNYAWVAVASFAFASLFSNRHLSGIKKMCSFSGAVLHYSVNKQPKYLLSKRLYSTTNNGAIASDSLDLIIKELNLNPVYVFENLDSENIRQQILKCTKGLSGIYMIFNKITKDYYIGSASTNRFYARFSNHVIYFRGSKIVKSAVKKYELKNFAFIILELYPNIVTKENNRDLLDLEDKYLKLLLPNYNILTEAGSSFGYKHTEIDRKKMKDFYSNERREIIGNLNRGKKFSPETIEKMRESALNRNPMSDETREKCKVHTRPVILYNLNGTVYGKYSTILEAADAINCNEKTIRRALNSDKKLVKKQWIVNDLSNK